MEQPDEELVFVFLDEPGPAASGDSSSKQRTEMFLGLLLLLVIIGWSLWVWRQEQQVGAYNAGKRYAVEKDWDRALASYRAAGDYADSAALRRQALAVAGERDRHYAAATEAVAHRAWIEALLDLRELRDIQPDYRDSSALYGAAENKTYSTALAGVVALRAAASPPGLYVREDQGWVWLPDSDGASSLRGYGPGGCFGYDAPFGNSSLDKAAANPNLFATSVLSVDLGPAARGMVTARIRGQRSARASANNNDMRDPAQARTEQIGKNCELARHASATDKLDLGAGIMAYIADRDLRARSDDGHVDLLLEHGVGRLFDTTR